MMDGTERFYSFHFFHDGFRWIFPFLSNIHLLLLLPSIFHFQLSDQEIDDKIASIDSQTSMMDHNVSNDLIDSQLNSNDDDDDDNDDDDDD